VNCARGELLDEPAVVEALQSGQLGGAGLDVYSHEPLKESPLMTLPNVILTPHIAGATNEAQEAVGVQIALQVREYLTKGVIQNAVNVPSIGEEEYQLMLPYIALGERLGTFLAQSFDDGVEEIILTYTGELAEWKTALIRNSAVAGALNQLAHAHERANLVNAAAAAEERGIRVTERKQKADGAPGGNALRMTFKRGQQENTVLGCVQDGAPRLLEIDGIHVEAPLEGNMIYLRNLDVPGVVGRVGTAMGQHNVNIANFSLGRGPIEGRGRGTGRRRRSRESAGSAAWYRNHPDGEGNPLRQSEAGRDGVDFSGSCFDDPTLANQPGWDFY
jgi:D-3-phosphoglycerate dehydrogenase